MQTKPKKESSHKPTKKIFTNEGHAIKVNPNGQTHSHPPTKIQVHPPLQPHPQAKAQPTQITQPPQVKYPLPEPPVLQHTESATKRVLRDNKKKPQTYLEEKFPETIAVPTTSSKSKPMSEGAKKCLNLIQKLKKHNCVGPFLQPVDVEGLGLYDYYDVVSEPMDLSTVEKKLKNDNYSGVYEFGEDVRKIWSNALAYNAEGSSIYNMTIRISQYFERSFKEIENVQFTDKVTELEKKVKQLTQEIAKLNKPEPISGKKVSGSGPRLAKSPSTNEEPMSIHEKKVLCDHIKRLPPDSLRGVWEIVSKGLPPNQNNKEELVFDIDALPVRVTRELERYVKSKISIQNSKSKNKKDTAKQVAVDPGYNTNQQYYNQSLRPEMNGGNYQPITPQALAQLPTNKSYMGMDIPVKAKEGDAASKSSDSSFISDSESGSDDEKKHKPKPVT